MNFALLGPSTPGSKQDLKTLVLLEEQHPLIRQAHKSVLVIAHTTSVGSKLDIGTPRGVAEVLQGHREKGVIA